MALEFEEILPYVEGEGDTGKTAREKINRNFTKIKPLANVGAEMQQLRQDVADDLEQLHDDVEEMVDKTTSLFGYYNCSTAGATAAKSVQVTGYELTTGGNIRIKMEHANTAASPVTLQIGNAAAKELYYNNEPVSDENTWEDNETIVVYYDGTSYYSTNSLGGGEGLKMAGIIVNKETGTNLLNPGEKEVGGIVVADGSVDSTLTDRYTSGFIPIEPATAYTLYGSSGSAHNVTAVGLYNSNKSKKLVRTGRNYITATESADAAYIRITDTFAGQVGIFKGENIPYSPYTNYSHTEYDSDNSFDEKTGNEILTKSDITPTITDVEGLKDKFDGVDEENFKGLTKSLEYSEEKSTNLVDPSLLTIGLIATDGTIDDSFTSYKTSDFIAIEPTNTYTLYEGGVNNMRYIGLYRADKSFISGTKIGNLSLIRPSDYSPDAAYIRCCSTLSPMGVLEGTNTPYENYYHNESVSYSKNNYMTKREDEILVKGDVSDTLERAEKLMSLVEYKENISTNLLNPSGAGVGYLLNTGNVDSTSAAAQPYETSGYVPIKEGEEYTFVGIRWVAFYNGEAFISGSWYNYGSMGTFTRTAPPGATTVRISCRKGTIGSCGIFQTGEYSDSDYEPYYSKKWIEYYGDNDVDESEISIIKSGNDYTVTNGKVSVNCTFDKTPNDIYGSSHCFNFLGATWAGISHGNYDDVAPMHMRGTTLGANHNYNQFTVKFTTDSFSDADIGGIISWVVDNVTFEGVIMRIVSSNTIVITNIQTSEYDYVTIRKPEGVVTYNNRGYTIAQTTDSQGNVRDDVTSTYVFPSLDDVSHKIMVDGIEVDGEDMSQINGNTIDFCESYELMNIKDIQDTLIDTQGDYAGDSIMHVDNIYRFCKDMTVLVISNYVFPVINGRFRDIMFNQAARINGSGNSTPVTQVTYYVPASSTEFAVPTLYNLSGRVSIIPVAGKTISRAMQIYNDAIFVLGILPVGVGANPSDYTTVPLEISETGKLYPHPVDKTHLNSNGVQTAVGESYSAVMYRKYLKVSEQKAGRICMYRVDYDGVAYIYIDYSQSMLDRVELNDTSLNGKTIEVVEQMNAELKTTIYNGGFFVLTDFAAGQSCYCIVKIKL